MKHTAIELPLGDPSGRDPITEEPAEGETVSPDISLDWLRVFGAPSPVVPDAAAPVSAAILAEVQALREHHIAKGHTPESDAAHGDWHFTDACREFLHRATMAKRPETRRKNLITAIGVLVAMADADDFKRSRQMERTTGGTLDHDA